MCLARPGALPGPEPSAQALDRPHRAAGACASPP